MMTPCHCVVADNRLIEESYQQEMREKNLLDMSEDDDDNNMEKREKPRKRRPHSIIDTGGG